MGLFSRAGRVKSSATAFTVTDVLVLVATILIIGALLLARSSKTEFKAESIVCLNNYRQLVTGWRLYANDSHDNLTYACVKPGLPQEPGAWVTGNIKRSPDNWDINQDLTRSPIWGLSGRDPRVWRCPGDPSRVTVAGESRPRLRSVSMNNWVGGIVWPGVGLDGGWGSNWIVYRKMSQMVDPGPARTWVFIDEREDTIDDSVWILLMESSRSGSFKHEPANQPAGYHGGAGAVSFADGHSELRKWNDQRAGSVASPQDRFVRNTDLEWLRERATRQR